MEFPDYSVVYCLEVHISESNGNGRKESSETSLEMPLVQAGGRLAGWLCLQLERKRYVEVALPPIKGSLNISSSCLRCRIVLDPFA
jgi:hypothetical protein